MNEIIQTTDQTEKLIEKLRRDLLVTRIFTGICSLLLICLLVGGYFVFKTVQGYAEQVETYMEEILVQAKNMEPGLNQLAHLDMDVLNETMEQMQDAFEEVNFAELSRQLEALDVEAINEQLAALNIEEINKKIEELDVEAFNEAVAGLDTEELSTALENLNNVTQKLRDMGDKLSSFGSSLFGK